MPYDLSKGGRYNLSKEQPGLAKVRAGLGWKPNGFDTGVDFDLDVSVFGLNADGKIAFPDYFIYYQQLRTLNGSIIHASGDSKDGKKEGDDEVIEIDLALLPPEVVELSFIVTIHDAAARRQNFGQVKNSYIKLYNSATGAELATYNLEDDFSMETAVQFGSLVKKESGWVFEAVGAGFKKGLGDFVASYEP